LKAPSWPALETRAFWAYAQWHHKDGNISRLLVFESKADSKNRRQINSSNWRRRARFRLHRIPQKPDAAQYMLNDIRFLKISKISIAGSTGFKAEHL
jgi:hypothetical protein